ncbi:MAG: glycoside hydrolase family 5 protein [Lachnospiraceae bacterium]|nr:glycoside hydrolase family 5 protein [Lachnospiraceae bacterium]
MKRKLAFFMTVSFLLCTIFPVCGCAGKKESEAMLFVKEMGNGINMGNSLDSTGLREYNPLVQDLDFETFWGNPPLAKEQFHAVKTAGFSTVRIPVTWQDHMDENGKVSPVWMERVDEVVRMALEEDLYVILDTHHEDWLDLEVNQKEKTEEKFAFLWEQIAQQFADCGEKLLFEGINEPRKRDSEGEWKKGTKESREMLNGLNQIFVDTVRHSGGNNSSRYLLLDSYASNPIGGGFEDFVLPEDPRLIVSVHAYYPYDFCQNMSDQASLSWDRGSRSDTKEMKQSFVNAKRKFLDRGIPVILTEFGCVDKSNKPERVEWTKYVMELSEKYGIPCLWWDEGKYYKILDRTSLTWEEEILKILTGKNE